jgi:hypothetical protein
VPFIYGKREQRRDLEEKREQLLSPPQDDWEYTSPPAKLGESEGTRPAAKA